MGLRPGYNFQGHTHMDPRGEHLKPCAEWAWAWASLCGSEEGTEAEDAALGVGQELTHRREKEKRAISQLLNITSSMVLNMDQLLH